MNANRNRVAGTNLVVATIEQQDPLVTDAAIGWRAAGAEIVLAAEIGADGRAVWSGEVQVQDLPAGKTRLCVREYELHPCDDQNGGGGLIDARRLVHADMIELDRQG